MVLQTAGGDVGRQSDELQGTPRLRLAYQPDAIDVQVS
jgi:hypothetical protein